MNCEQMNELLSAWLDGELSEGEQKQMEKHLEQCAQCRALLEQLKTLHTSFSDLEEIPAPEGFAQRVMARVEKETKPKVIPLFKRPRMRSFAALAACAVLFVGIGRVALSGGSAQKPELASYGTAGFAKGSAPMSGDLAQEPAALMPEMAALPEQKNFMSAEVESTADCVTGGQCQIVLSRLPEGLEEKLGVLNWETRIEDGAQCARLTQEQARMLLELVNAQNLEPEKQITEEGTEESWLLVWLPN